MDKIISLTAAILITIPLFTDYRSLLHGGWKWIISFGKLLVNPKMLITFGIAWMITNGWSYLFVLFGGIFQIKWMLTVGLSYQAFLWLPITPEKIITVAISLPLARFIFPNDKKLQEGLKSLSPNAKVKGG